jgi:hypothetical protein
VLLAVTGLSSRAKKPKRIAELSRDEPQRIFPLHRSIAIPFHSVDSTVLPLALVAVLLAQVRDRRVRAASMSLRRLTVEL